MTSYSVVKVQNSRMHIYQTWMILSKLTNSDQLNAKAWANGNDEV